MTYSLGFKVLAEIRMGSPYHFAEVQLAGDFIPNIAWRGFQDKGIVSRDQRRCYLIHWEKAQDGGPAFTVWKIDEIARSIMKSQLIEGCCQSITELEQGDIQLTVWQFERKIRIEIVKEFSERILVSE